jgi:Ca2+-binding RTX toxin-like protein
MMKRNSNKVYPTDNDDTLLGSNRGDYLHGRGGNDTLLDVGNWYQPKTDKFFGDDGNDVIRTRWGRDVVDGGADDDLIVSRADAGEPLVAQDSSISPYNEDQPIKARYTNDKLTGGTGADTFVFRMDLNARPDIIAKHVDEDGNIDWEGVAGENGEAHLHWVEGIGTDTITDYSKTDGDMIKIAGHTAAIDISYADWNGDGIEESIIAVRSDQGGAGSHNGDSLGTIVVYGERVEVEDVAVNSDVHYGVFSNIDEILIA